MGKRGAVAGFVKRQVITADLKLVEKVRFLPRVMIPKASNTCQVSTSNFGTGRIRDGKQRVQTQTTN